MYDMYDIICMYVPLFLLQCCLFYFSPLALCLHSFCFAAGGEESDMRFVYCACCISYVLNDWSGVDVERTVDFIRRSQVHVGRLLGRSSAHGSSTHTHATMCIHMCVQYQECIMSQKTYLLCAPDSTYLRMCVFVVFEGFHA